jgi:hypothetical protein
MSIANSCRTQWVQKIIQEKQAQYTGIIDLFQVQNVSKLYIQCNFFTDLGCLEKRHPFKKARPGGAGRAFLGWMRGLAICSACP